VAAAAIEFIFGALADNPHRVGRPLRYDLEGLHSAHRGDYRVVYRIDDRRRQVHILAIAIGRMSTAAADLGAPAGLVAPVVVGSR